MYGMRTTRRRRTLYAKWPSEQCIHPRRDDRSGSGGKAHVPRIPIKGVAPAIVAVPAGPRSREFRHPLGRPRSECIRVLRVDSRATGGRLEDERKRDRVVPPSESGATGGG
jgi:hypothetical protein